MGFLASVDSWVSGLFEKGGHRGTSPRDLSSFLATGQGTGGLYPSAWTDSRIEQVRHFKHWVYVAVSTIADTVARQFPNVSKVLTPQDPTGTRKTKTFVKKSVSGGYKAITPLQAHEMLENVHDDHPLVRLLRDPNDPDTAYDLWYETVVFLLLTGNAYWYVPRVPGTNIPAALWVIPSHWVWPIVGKKRLVDAYELRPIEGNYLRKELPLEDVIHFKRKSPISKIDGYAPLSAIPNWVDTQESIDKLRWFSFRNGAFPGVAIEFDGKYLDPSDEDFLRIEAKFMQRYSGEVRANKPLFLPPGCTLKHFTLSPKEMGYLESADQLKRFILAAYKVPPVMAGDAADMTYGSLLAQMAAYCVTAINPLTSFLGQVASEKLAPLYPDGKALRVWYEDITPEDPELLEKQYLTDAALGAITPNELRAERGRQAYSKGGDDPLVQSNLAILPLVTGGEPKPIVDRQPRDQPRGRDDGDKE